MKPIKFTKLELQAIQEDVFATLDALQISGIASEKELINLPAKDFNELTAAEVRARQSILKKLL
jgi:hypothetical protein